MIALAIVAAFALGAWVAFWLTKGNVEDRAFRAGYFHGFNYAWDEKGRVDRAIEERHRKDLRKRKPSFKLIKGEKER